MKGFGCSLKRALRFYLKFEMFCIAAAKTGDVKSIKYKLSVFGTRESYLSDQRVSYL